MLCKLKSRTYARWHIMMIWVFIPPCKTLAAFLSNSRVYFYMHSKNIFWPPRIAGLYISCNLTFIIARLLLLLHFKMWILRTREANEFIGDYATSKWKRQLVNPVFCSRRLCFFHLKSLLLGLLIMYIFILQASHNFLKSRLWVEYI